MYDNEWAKNQDVAQYIFLLRRIFKIQFAGMLAVKLFSE